MSLSSADSPSPPDLLGSVERALALFCFPLNSMHGPGLMVTSSLPAILGGVPVRPHGPPDWPPRDAAISQAVAEAMTDGSWGKYRGRHTERLNQALAKLHANREVVLCASGTAAIELALRGLRVGSADEVILADYDFKGNFLNVAAVGATPVLVDLEPNSCVIDVERIDDAITPATKAILVSHLHGGLVDMPALIKLASRRGVFVVEDACQSPGGLVQGRTAGTWGDVGVISFGGSKLLCAGRGGALITERAEVIQRIRLHTFRGNDAYPLSELQACVLIPQLEALEERNQTRCERVASLRRRLEPVPGLTLLDAVPNNGSRPGYYKTAFLYDAEKWGMSRERFVAAMRAEGVAIDEGFRALHSIHSRARYRSAGPLSQAEARDRDLVVLHHPVLLEPPEALDEIVEALDKVRAHATMIQDRALNPRYRNPP